MYSYNDIEKWVDKHEFPKYRTNQIYQAVCKEFIKKWNEAKTLPAELRELLDQELPISSLKAGKVLKSKRGDAIKIAFETGDEFIVEAVLMRHKGDRNTVCVSVQVGCSMGCRFCATGALGCKRNLEAPEIVDQVLEFARILKKDNSHITNVVFMGMGEPFLNYDNVLQAIKIMHDSRGLNIGARSMTVSTSGIIPGIKKFAQESMQLNLAISLHAANNKIRSALMPINRKYPLEKLLPAVADYMQRTNRKVFFEYILLGNKNDSFSQAKALAELLTKYFKNYGQLVHINLIDYNPVYTAGINDGAGFRSSPKEKIIAFQEILKQAGFSVTVRFKFGQEIQAGCGQLAGG